MQIFTGLAFKGQICSFAQISAPIFKPILGGPPPNLLKHFFRFLARALCAAPQIGKNAKSAEPATLSASHPFRQNSAKFRQIHLLICSP